MFRRLHRPYTAVHTSRLIALCVSFLMMLSACSGVGVVATSDPNKKLAQAEDMQSSGRIAKARQLMSEAAELFSAEKDQEGVAEAYRRTAFLIRIYGDGTILGRQNTEERKLDVTTADKSSAYFERARAIQQELEDYALVSHLEYNIGVNYALSNRTREACSAFDRSLTAYRAEKTRRPEHDPELPPGIASFEAFIDQARLEAGCA
ncbi:hypothetical protein [Denitrobaculum tricleocarpae]|uniref:Tetratricopeptide repeat protein n=1 Tax=Denitrobaculum tricleocarpae TaxID=2591009 RepID=A0A545TPZ0_9PROT|nr:hypothetical protein [Denitrobaculum tricleocarpae]TQV79258.1 hypothetical protein FKG95_16535 [Denitrobaculum tricleocarpae]